MHSVEYVIDLCQYLTGKYPIDTINFFDDTLSVTSRRVVEICEGFLRRGLHKTVKWRLHLRADQVEYELLKLMSAAGCFYVSFGAESGSDRILGLLNKDITASQNLAAAESIKKAGLFFGTSIILGTPGETEAEMEETFTFCRKIQCDSIGVGRFCPLPGSPSYADFVRAGRIDPRNVDWETLGNFSLSDGPVYADVEPMRFREIFAEIQQYCNRKNWESFVRNHRDRYPEVVRALSFSNAYPGREASPMKKVARRIVPAGMRRFLKQVINS